jgi:hypothetical protein
MLDEKMSISKINYNSSSYMGKFLYLFMIYVFTHCFLTSIPTQIFKVMYLTPQKNVILIFHYFIWRPNFIDNIICIVKTYQLQ